MTNPAPEPRPPCAQAAHSVSCQECVDFLLDYIDGVLPPEQKFKFESHLALCRDCAVYLDNYRKAVELAERAGAQERDRAPRDVPAKLIDAILRARKRP